MDAAVATVVLSSVNAAMNSASQEAGKQTWQSLVALVRRARREPDAVVEPVHADSLTATLIEAAGRDPQFAADLCNWIESIARLAGSNDTVNNTVSNGARITGNVVQGRDFSGPITFG
jgi:Tfp pilus assembly protein PilV